MGGSKGFENEKGARCKICLMDCIRTIQKDLTGGKGWYAHSSSHEFRDWMDRKYPDVPKWSVGKAGHGKRFDAWLECSPFILLLSPYIVEFLNEKISARKSTLLDESCYYRLVTSQFECALVAVTISWDALFCELRYLCATVIEGWRVYDMARIANALDVYFRGVIDGTIDLNQLLQPGSHILSLNDFPELTEFREYRQGERIEALDDIILRHQKSAELKPMTLVLLKAFIIGCNDSLVRNCRRWISSLDGDMCWEKWTPDRKRRAEGSPLHTISLCESTFGLFKHVHDHLLNAKFGTIAGVVSAKKNGTCDDDVVEEVGGMEMFCAMLAAVKKHLKKYDSWTEADKKARKECRTKQFEDAVQKGWDTLITKQATIIEYCGLQRPKTKHEVKKILDSDEFMPIEKKKSKRIRFLTVVSKIFTIGFDMTEHIKAYSSINDANLGTEEELTERVNAIYTHVERDKSILKRPPKILQEDIQGIEGYADMNAAVVRLNESRRNRFSEDMCNYSSSYSPTLNRPWGDVKLAKWPDKLTPLQLECKTGRIFVETTAKEYMCDGIEWKSNEDDYILYFHLHNDQSSKGRNRIKDLSDDRVEFAYFKSDVDEETEEGYYGVADWEFVWLVV
jgi:hypothetical protein